MDPQAQALVTAGKQIELARIPLWSGVKDVFTAEQWIDRISRSKAAGAWNDVTTMAYIFNALRGDALTWFDALPVFGYNRDVWEDFKTAFLRTYGTTRTVRTAAITLSDIKQGSSEPAAKYISRVVKIITDVQTMAPAALPPPATPWTAAVTALPGFAALPQAEKDAQLQLLLRHGAQDAYHRLGMQLFIAGLKPTLRTELMKSNPTSMREALDAVLDAEKISMDPVRTGQRAQLAPVEDTPHEVDSEAEDSVDGEDEDADTIAVVSAKLKKLKQKAAARKAKLGGGSSKPPPNKSKPGGPSGKAGAERGSCWYCSAKGHMQSACYRRIAAGAPMVNRHGKPLPPRDGVNALQQQMQQLSQQQLAMLQRNQDAASSHNPFQHMSQSENLAGGAVGAIWNKNPWERVGDFSGPPPPFPLNY